MAQTYLLDDSSDELEEDESKNGIEEGIEELEEEDENDEDDEDESDEDNDDDDDNDILLNRDYEFVKPGVKSGSTGVVALLKGNQLYVANVGDSRCVVCREGEFALLLICSDFYHYYALLNVSFNKIEIWGAILLCS